MSSLGKRPASNNPLQLAARYNDAEAEERGLELMVASMGLDIQEVIYVAEQRAMRMVMVLTGRLDEIDRIQRQNERQPLAFSEEDSARITELTPLYMDAIALGWRARKLTEEDNNEH